MTLRPRFSVRTLAIVVTLVCEYIASYAQTVQWWAVFEESPGPVAYYEAEYSVPGPLWNAIMFPAAWVERNLGLAKLKWEKQNGEWP